MDKEKRIKSVKTSLLKSLPTAAEQVQGHKVRKTLFRSSSTECSSRRCRNRTTISTSSRCLFVDLAEKHETLQAGKKWIDATALRNSMICFSEYQNIHGKIFGGFLMKQAFELASATTKLHAKVGQNIV